MIDTTLILNWINMFVVVPTNMFQVAYAAVIFAGAFYLHKHTHEHIKATVESYRKRNTIVKRLTRTVDDIIAPLGSLLVLWTTIAVMTVNGLDDHTKLLNIIASLFSAWIAIRFSTTFVDNKLASKVIAIGAWGLASLHIVGLLNPTINFLNSVVIKFGENQITLLTIIDSILIIAALLWLAIFISNMINTILDQSEDITPSVQVLISKIAKFVLISFAFIFGLTAAGIDMTMLTVFGGALGIGIGLGLQRPTANIISGIILLLDKSIKPGDTIELFQSSSNQNHGKFGIVSRMQARYAEVVDRNGRAHLIPNEELLNRNVINYSHGSTKFKKAIRREIFFSTSNGLYDPYTNKLSEPDPDLPAKYKAIIEEAAGQPGRIISEGMERPAAHIMGITGNTFEWKLRFWINDPHNGASNITGLVFMEIWKAFAREGIHIPIHMQKDVISNGDPHTIISKEIG